MMVLLTTTPRMLAAISQIPPPALSSLPSPLPSTTDAPIAHTTLVTLSRLARQHGVQDYTLNALLRGTAVYKPPPAPKVAPSAEYVALMARLRAEQEAREYRNLVSKSTSHAAADDPSFADTEDQDPITPSVVFNILLSVVMCGVAMFHMTRWWGNDALRVLASMLVALIVGVAEVVVYAGYVRNVRRGKEKERRKLERKAVIGEYKGEGDEVPLQLDDADGQWERKEEIWGKGKHGGMRRRVREKWEREQVAEETKEKDTDAVVRTRRS